MILPLKQPQALTHVGLQHQLEISTLLQQLVFIPNFLDHQPEYLTPYHHLQVFNHFKLAHHPALLILP